jgi:hypothetical protein
MDKINKIAECIKAFQEGKDIEVYIPTGTYKGWSDIQDDVELGLAIADYIDEQGDIRIKKESIAIWANWYALDNTFGAVYLNKDEAVCHCGKGGIAMKFIEDLS